MRPFKLNFGQAINPSFASVCQKRHQGKAYRDGSALMNHVRTAHGGMYDPACAGCRELKEKTEQAQELS